MQPSQNGNLLKGNIEEVLMVKNEKYPNRLGIIGWFAGGRWGPERYLYALHRVTGLAMLLYLLLHIFVTATRIFGREVWEKWMVILDSPLFSFGELLVFAAFAFHSANGIRLILIELGFAVGKPEEPIYPYRSSLDKQRPLTVLVIIVAAILIAAAGCQFLMLFHR